MPLIPKSVGPGTTVQLPKVIADQLEAFAEAGGYTFKSVVMTACEEFLERLAGDRAGEDDDVDVDEAPRPLTVKLTASQKALRDRGES